MLHYGGQSYVAGATELQLGILSTMSAPQPEDNPNSDLPSTCEQSGWRTSCFSHLTRILIDFAR